MILKRLIAPNILHKVIQLELLSKTSLFANSCRPPQLGRTSTTLANTKQCINSNVLSNGSNHSLKFQTIAALCTHMPRKTPTPTGDHVRVWVLEKLTSAALPIIIPAAMITENAILDGLMCVLIVMHSHWGLEAIITDYARPSVVGTLLPKLLHVSLVILSAATLTGLFLLINNGPGVSKSIKDAWAIGKNPPNSAS